MNIDARLDDNSGAVEPIAIAPEARAAVDHYRRRAYILNVGTMLARVEGREADATNGHYWRVIVERALEAEIVDPEPRR
jgi:hypothetical protein